MALYGNESFDVYFAPPLNSPIGLLKVGDQISVDIEPQAKSNSVDTSDGTRNLINKNDKSNQVKFERLDFPPNNEEHLALQDMIEINRFIPSCTITSRMRYQDEVEYLAIKSFFDGVIVPSEKWTPGDSWRQNLTVNFDKRDPDEFILI